mgnify:CR=1 FL=1
MSIDAVTGWVRSRRLAAEGILSCVVASAFLATGYRTISALSAHSTAIRWVSLAGILTAAMAGFVVFHRGNLRRPNGMRVHSIGLANALTLVRALVLGGVAGFVLVDVDGVLSWGPALGYGTVVLLDGLDGAVARSVGMETRLGARLDMAVDTTGFLVGPLVAVMWGLLPAWYLTLSFARYAYRGGCVLFRWWGGEIGPLPPSRVRRPLSGLQMGFITGALVPIAPTHLVWTVAPVVLVPSLVVFARDWIAVTVHSSEE